MIKVGSGKGGLYYFSQLLFMLMLFHFIWIRHASISLCLEIIGGHALIICCIHTKFAPS